MTTKASAAKAANNKAPKIKAHEYVDFEWRTGTKRSPKAKSVYAQLDDKPGKEDVIIGTFISPAIAAHIVEAHNGLFHFEV